ncbi:MAG: hypothetical protein AAGD10_12385 [Myxococcota bacterium]
MKPWVWAVMVVAGCGEPDPLASRYFAAGIVKATGLTLRGSSAPYANVVLEVPADALPIGTFVGLAAADGVVPLQASDTPLGPAFSVEGATTLQRSVRVELALTAPVASTEVELVPVFVPLGGDTPEALAAADTAGSARLSAWGRVRAFARSSPGCGVTVVPPGAINVGDVPIGATQTVTVAVQAERRSTLDAAWLEPADDLAVRGLQSSVVLEEGATLGVGISFSPTRTGPYEATFVLRANGQDCLRETRQVVGRGV